MPQPPEFPVHSPAQVSLPVGADESLFRTHIKDSQLQAGQERWLLLDFPARADDMKQLRRGLALGVSVNNGSQYWSFQATVTGFSSEGLLGFWVRCPDQASAYTAIQQREFVRVNVSRPIALSHSSGSTIKGLTLNLSGGGLSIRTAELLPVGQCFQVRFSTRQDAPDFVHSATVLSCSASKEATGQFYDSRLAFEKLTEKAQTLILKECFRLQVEQQHKGLSYNG